jgi:predicted metal-dependent hydrolase
MHLPPTRSPRVPGSRSTETVRDTGQLDWLRAFAEPAPESAGAGVRPSATSPGANGEKLKLRHGSIEVSYVRHPRARRYRLLFRRDGTARCTIPRGGTLSDAKRFVTQNEAWLDERLARHQQSKPAPIPLGIGGSILFDGVETPVVPVEPGTVSESGRTLVRIGPVEMKVDGSVPDLKPQVEKQLRKYATGYLPERLRELGKAHGLDASITRISVRSQRTRWGSCTRRGVISLNWRLIQLPSTVRDYVLLHELAHLRHLNHSPRFWAEVERLCPAYQEAERWLRQSGKLVF